MSASARSDSFRWFAQHSRLPLPVSRSSMGTIKTNAANTAVPETDEASIGSNALLAWFWRRR